VPLSLLLKSLDEFFVINSLALAHLSKHILNSRHHSLQTAEVHVGTGIKLGEDLIGVLLNLVLDVHLSSLLVVLFTRKCVVKTEVIGELFLGGLEFIVVEKSIGVGNSKEQPGLSLVNIGGGGGLEEKTTDESTEWGNSSSCGNHDVIGGGVLLGHEHNLTGGSGHHDFVTGLGVTQEVGADSLLGWIVGLELRAPVGGTTDTEGSSLSGHIITVTGGGDGVKADSVRFAILLTDTWWDNTPGLSLDVGEVTVVVDDDVAGLSGGLGSNNTLGGNDLSGEGGLVLVGVDLDVGVVMVGGVFEEILLQVEGSSVVFVNFMCVEWICEWRRMERGIKARGGGS
jgi:hypothetical protein